MKKLIFIATLSLVAVFLLGHPASEIDLNFNTVTHKLTITFNHSVNDTQKHYISKAEVYLDDHLVLSHNLSQQESNAGGILMYKLPNTKAGQVIKAKLTCNKRGILEEELTIP